MSLSLIIEIGGVLSIVVAVYGIFYKFDKSIDSRMAETKEVQMKMNENQIKHTVVLDKMLDEITEIKTYEGRISKNETDIAVINERCGINHKE